MLVGIELINYALFSHLTLGLTESALDSVKTEDEVAKHFPLGQLVAIVGRSDSGKSTLFDALHFLSDCLIHDVPYAAASAGRGGFFELRRKNGDGPMRLRLLFKQGSGNYIAYDVALNADLHNRPFVESERVKKASFGPDGVDWTDVLNVQNSTGTVLGIAAPEAVSLVDGRHLALASYGRLLNYTTLCFLYAQISRWFVSSDRTMADQAVGRTKGGHRHISPRFDNIRNVLQYWESDDPKKYNQLIDYIKERVPDFKRTGDAFLDHDVRSGSMRLFALILLLMDPKPRPLVCLDHPDTNLYHDAIDMLTFEMREYLRRNAGCQVFLTTYNANTIENLRPSEVYLFSRRMENGLAMAHAVGRSETVKAMLKEGIGMSAIWYGGYFEPDTP